MTEKERVESRKRVAIDTLTERFGRDEIPMDEFERLVADLNAASSLRELAVVEDIAAGVSGYAGSAVAAAAAAGVGDSRASDSDPDAAGGFIGQDQVQSCAAILSERHHRGDWLRKPNVAAATVLASQVFDFTETGLLSGTTTLEVLAVLGSVEITVPAGVAVRMDVSPVLGDVKVDRGVGAREAEGGPLLVVTGNAILGSVVVKRA